MCFCWIVKHCHVEVTIWSFIYKPINKCSHCRAVQQNSLIECDICTDCGGSTISIEEMNNAIHAWQLSWTVELVHIIFCYTHLLLVSDGTRSCLYTWTNDMCCGMLSAFIDRDYNWTKLQQESCDSSWFLSLLIRSFVIKKAVTALYLARSIIIQPPWYYSHQLQLLAHWWPVIEVPLY